MNTHVQQDAYFHFVARCRWNRAPLFDPVQALWLWLCLRRAFPEALAVCVMPNHVHLLLPTGNPDSVRRRLACLLAAMSRKFGHWELWEPVPLPDAVQGPAKLARVARYVALNPCRTFKVGTQAHRLVADPLEWPWSTHRDSVGAAADPWVGADAIAAALGRSSAHAAADWHRYVTSADDVDPAAGRLPSAARPVTVPEVPLKDVARAVAVAMRLPEASALEGVRGRRVVVALAEEQGWTDRRLLSEMLRVQPARVRQLSAESPPPELAAARLCLGDERLLRPRIFQQGRPPMVDSAKVPQRRPGIRPSKLKARRRREALAETER